MSFASSLLLPFLNHDIMTYIFKLNTQRDRGVFITPKPSALHTTRLTSQVCRSWRHLILQSPVLWGNIIDLKTLSEGSEQWFEEVMKCTGKARLSIYGQVEDNSTLKRAISLLEENWDRVHSLDVAVVVHEQVQEIDLNHFCDIFWKRQAPILEEFSVGIYGRCRSDERKREDLTLFSGSAPLLRRIHSPDFYFDQHAPWIYRLVGMTLSGPLKICDALAVLANTPLLESLVIRSTVRYDDSAKSWNQNIHLPNLHLINVTSNIAGSLFYLSHITPRSDCVLRLLIAPNPFDIQKSKNNDWQRLSKIISAYMEGYFSVHCPQKLHVYIEEHCVGYETSEKWDEAEDLGCREPSFNVSIASHAVIHTFDPPVVNMLLSTLIPTTLNNVHTFEFTVVHSWWPTTDAIIHIIRSLTAVERMTLTPWAMHSLNSLSDSATPFPNLAEVTIEYQTKVKNLDQILCLFLTRRREAGKPLQTLYKPDNSRPRGAKHWDFLKQFQGLRVISTGHGEDGDSYRSDGWVDGSDESDGDGDDWAAENTEYYDHDEDYEVEDEDYEDEDEDEDE